MVTVVAKALDDEDDDDDAPSVLAVALPVSASTAAVPDCEINQVAYDE
jgi:hypothetical protein